MTEHEKYLQARIAGTKIILGSAATKKLIVAGPGTGKSFLFREICKQNIKNGKSSADTEGENMIFATSAGNPILRRQIQREFKKILFENNLPEIRFHDLRHTAASLMLGIGTPVLQVSRQLGHAQASTTLDIYGHLIPGLPSDSAEQLDQLLMKPMPITEKPKPRNL